VREIVENAEDSVYTERRDMCRAMLTWLLLALVSSSCGAPGTAANRGGHWQSPAEGVTLAILPAEARAYPRLVAKLNDALRGARVNGVGKTFVSKASLEVVQLSIECVDLSAPCWTAVGKSLSADRLLFGQIESIPARRRPQVKVKVTLFDVGTGDVLGESFRTFASEDEAGRSLQSLIDDTLRAVLPAARVEEAPVSP
jgi:hypothetical protein